jgi:tetratricopeptide (TPR) repeat protein
VQNREVATVHQPAYTPPEGEQIDEAHELYNQGCAYSLSGDIASAEAAYTKAIELNPSLAEAYYNRGLARMALKHHEEAVSDLSKAGELGLYQAYSLIKHFRRVQQGKK